MPVGDGSDVLLWAPAGASRVRELRRGQDYATVATAGGRVAWVGAEGTRDGTRVSVIDATTRRIVFRGPPAFDVRQLSFDGRNVAFATSLLRVRRSGRAGRRPGARSPRGRACAPTSR